MRRRIMASVGGKPLPYDAEVEWLETTGEQRINLAMKGSENVRIRLDAQVISRDVGTGLFGSFGGHDASMYIYIGNGQLWQAGYGDYINLYLSDTDRHVFELDDFKFKIDGILKHDYQPMQFTTAADIYLLTMSRTNGTVYNGTKMKFYGFDLWDYGVLKFSFAPVRKDGEGILYDRVSGQLFRNEGTGAFVIGPDK